MDLNNKNALTGLMDNFVDKCIAGAANVEPYALKLLILLATIELALFALLSALDEGENLIHFLTKKVLKYGFYIWLIQNWATGISITKQIFEFFSAMGGVAAGMELKFFPGFIATSGIEHATSVLNTIRGSGFSVISVDNILKLLLAFIIFLCFAGTAIYMFIIKIQFFLVATLTTILLPFGVNKFTSFLSEKVIGAIFSLGIKMMTLQFVCCLVGAFLASLVPKETGGLSIPGILQLVVGCAAAVYLTLNAPTLASDLLSGSPSLGDNAARGAVNAGKMATGAVTGGVSAAMGAYGTVQAAMNAKGGRTDGGKISLGGTAKNLGAIFRQQMPDRQNQQQGKTLISNARAIEKEGRIREANKNQTSLPFD